MIVSALQKQTKQYITSTSGVEVKEVRVFVDTSSNMGLKHAHDKPKRNRRPIWTPPKRRAGWWIN